MTFSILQPILALGRCLSARELLGSRTDHDIQRLKDNIECDRKI